VESIDAFEVSFDMVKIPTGSFVMGSSNDLFSEAPAHLVTLSSPFFLGRYPVTRAQWLAVMGSDPSGAGREPDCPVDSINWDEAQEFCQRLCDASGRRVRLPSEAERLSRPHRH
jgi:formylglycine-generating enzyme required for sulfatase activity